MNLWLPVRILKIEFPLLAKKANEQRLLGSLHMDISKTSTLLGCKPPTSVDEGLCRAVQQRL